LGFFSKAKKQAIKAVQKKFGGYYSQVIHIPPAMNTADYLRSYGEIGWLFACVSKISQNVGASEWKAYKGEKAVESSRALDLFKHPSPYMSQNEMLVRISGFLNLTGKAFLYIAKDGLGRPKEIWVINPMDMWVVPDKEEFIKGYIYRAGIEQMPLDKDEVIFFSLPDFLNPYNGIGPAQAAATALESDKYSSQWNRNFFYNNAEPQGILTMPDVSDDDFDRLKAEWNDKHKGVDNAKRTAMVRGEGVTYTAIQISQKDMDFFNLRNQSRDEILGIFGVHKSILGLTDDVSRANAETAEYVFQAHVIKPSLGMIADKLNNGFVQMFGEDIELRPTDNVPENKDFIKGVLDTQVNKTITVNEGRDIVNKLLGLQLAHLAEGDVIYQAVMLQPMGAVPPMSPPAVAPATGGDLIEGKPKALEPAAELLLLESKALDKATRKKIAKAVVKNNSTRHDDFMKLSAPLIAEFETVINKFFAAQFKAITPKVIAGNKDPISVSEWNAKLQKLVAPLYDKAFQTGGRAVVNEFKGIGNYIHKDTGIRFDFKDAGVRQMIKDKVNKIVDINEFTRDWVKDTIGEAYDSEEYNDGRTFTIPDVTNMLGNVFSPTRARTIAQTECLTSLNQATSETYKQNADILDGKYWMDSSIGVPRETHIKAGQDYNEENAIPVNESFVVAGYECDCPGDSSLPAEEVVNCHCCMAPKVNLD